MYSTRTCDPKQSSIYPAKEGAAPLQSLKVYIWLISGTIFNCGTAELCGNHHLGPRIPLLSNPISPDTAAQRSVIFCWATSAEMTCPQSPSAGSQPYCYRRSYATCLVSWPAWPCGAGGVTRWWWGLYTQQDYGRFTVPEIGPSSQFSVGAECFPHLLYGTVTRWALSYGGVARVTSDWDP